jgi:hypothetical protein
VFVTLRYNVQYTIGHALMYGQSADQVVIKVQHFSKFAFRSKLRDIRGKPPRTAVRRLSS